MELAYMLVAFVFGTLVASFIGVLVARMHTGQSFLFGGSRCDVCGVPLPSSALVPVLSYVLFRGRARCCGARLSFVSPASELALGILFAAAYLSLGATLALACFLVALSLLAALILYDLAHQILPPALLWLFIAASALFYFLSVHDQAVREFAALSAIAFALFFALLHLLSGGRAMGFADSPLVFGLALLAGRAALAGFLFSFWIGAGVGILILVKRPRGARMNIEVPFAPFLAAGFLLAYFTQWDPFSITAFVLGALPAH